MTREEHLKTAILLLNEAVTHLSLHERLTPPGRRRHMGEAEIRQAKRTLVRLTEELETLC